MNKFKKFLKIVAPFAHLGLLCFSAMACSSFGPEPMVNIVKPEIKKTKKVKGILFAHPAGMEWNSKIEKAYLGGLASTYLPPKGKPMEAISAVLTPIGLPKEVVHALFASYQFEFMEAAHKHDADKKAKAPTKITLPKLGKIKAPKGLKGAKALKAKLASFAKGAGDITKALEGHDPAKVKAALEQNKDLVPYLNAMANYVLKEAGITYLATGFINGDEAAYNGKKPVSLSVALVNIKNGNMRFFASVDGTKGSIPTPWLAHVGILSQSVFSGANEKAPVPGT